MENTENTKKRILEAAEARFIQYGFGKTTMAEIAGDCSMSAANIYRFFESKKEIAAELANVCLTQTEESLRKVVQQKGLKASDRLEAFISELLQKSYDLCHKHTKINELVEFIHNERHDLIGRHREVKRSFIAEILAEGNRNGEFDEENIVETAELILKATLFFCYPGADGEFPIQELKRDAKAISSLLIRGLGKR